MVLRVMVSLTIAPVKHLWVHTLRRYTASCYVDVYRRGKRPGTAHTHVPRDERDTTDNKSPWDLIGPKFGVDGRERGVVRFSCPGGHVGVRRSLVHRES